jgi:methylenetetrahydrofolate reductase (NADPH)
MAKITQYISEAKSTLFSFEILPPLKGESIQSVFKGIDPLMEFKPPFIDVTYHREEVVYKEHPGGLLEKKSIKKRPGTVAICAAIMHHFKVDAVPHLIIGGFNKEETENALIDLHFLGVDNILALRGDSLKNEIDFRPEPNGHQLTSQLVAQIHNMNKGKYLDEDLKDAFPTNFCIGVAGYPEKHCEAPNLQSDIRFLKEKVAQGAEYIVTQMFFDNAAYFRFVDACREADINIPIIPGLKPLTTRKQLQVLPKTFYIDLPDALSNEIEKAKTDAEVKEIGIEWCKYQSKELMDRGVPVLHYYTMGKSDAVKKIAESLF